MGARLLRSIRSHVAEVILISRANPSDIGEFREIDLQHGVFKRPMRDRYRTAARQPLSSVNLKHSNSANSDRGERLSRWSALAASAPICVFHCVFVSIDSSDQALFSSPGAAHDQRRPARRLAGPSEVDTAVDGPDRRDT